MSGVLKVLGIDPGSRSTGWAVVTREAGRYRLLASGAIRPDPSGPMPTRLLEIHHELLAVLALHAPDVVAIEAIFAHKSSTSALVLGQARGVALVAAAGAGKAVYEYNANTVKSAVAGSGRADKEAVGKMVAMLLGGHVEGPHDAADAVAIAMTHHAHAHRHAAAARVATVPRAAARPAVRATGARLPTTLAEFAAQAHAHTAAPGRTSKRAGAPREVTRPPQEEEEP
jgi:crossover junction endodeoxyribonuclease RuvC